MQHRKSPAYQRIFLILREKIMNGNFSAGDRIPSESELSQEFGVSRITTGRALAELVREGLVVRQRGRGTTVRNNIPLVANFDGSLGSLEKSNQAIGKTTVRVTAYSYGDVEPQVGFLIGANENKAFHLERIRLIDQKPFCLVTTFLPPEIGKLLSPAELEESALADLLQKTGIKIGKAKQTISATVADLATAQRLDVEVGSPLLRVDRTVYGEGANVVYFFTALFRPDLFRLSMSLAGEAAANYASGWEETNSISISV